MSYIVKHQDGMYLRTVFDVDSSRTINDFRDVPQRYALRFALKKDAWEAVDVLNEHVQGWHVVRLAKKLSAKCRVYHHACFEHGFYHGAEAEELREGIENILKSWRGETTGSADEDFDGIKDDLQTLVDTVDARDSLAYREAMPQPGNPPTEHEQK